MGLAGREAAAVAAGALLHYIQKTKQGAVEHIDGVRYYERSSCLELDAVSVRNLELVEPLFSGESAQTTLFYTLDACCTPMGKRLLRATLLRPASELGEIEARLEAVAEAFGDLRGREGVRRAMDGVLDVERLLARVALDSAGPREVMALAGTLGRLPGLVGAVRVFKSARWRALGGVGAFGEGEQATTRTNAGVLRFAQNDKHLVVDHERSLMDDKRSADDEHSVVNDEHSGPVETEAVSGFDALEDLHGLIVKTIAEEPPVNLADGGVIRAGVDAELDELRELGRSGRQALAAIEERERAADGDWVAESAVQ